MTKSSAATATTTGFASVDPARLPARGANRQLFDERASAVASWQAGLPLADIPETARLLMDGLDRLQGAGLSPGRRIAILQQLETTADYVVDGLRRHYLHQSFPLPGRSQRAANLSRHLRETMARGYRSALLYAETRGGLSSRSRTLALTALARCIEQCLLESWLVYESPPIGAWRLLHSIRLEARRLGLNARRCRMRTATVTLDQLYQRALLTSAAGPYRMARSKVLRAHELLLRVAPDAVLTAQAGNSAESPLYFVDTDGDHGPQPVISNNTGDEARYLYLGTAAVVDSLLEQARPGGVLWWQRRPAADDAHLLRSLAAAYGSPRRRHYQRSGSRTRAVVIVGLTHVHRALSQQQADQDIPHAASQFAGRNLQGHDDHDVWNLIYPAEDGTALALQNDDQIDLPAPAPTDQTEHFWQLVNLSAGGYCLLSEPDTASRAQVGEPVLITELTGSGEAPRQLGIIRWLRRDPDAGGQIGVQIIAPEPHPVYTRAEQADGRLSDPSRSLLVPAVKVTRQPVTLMTPPLHYHSSRRVSMLGQGKSAYMRLTRELERTDGLAQFVFERTEGASREAADSDAKDNLWADI